jgi:hypothetical protein
MERRVIARFYAMTDDPVAIGDLADQAMKAAEKVGVSPDESEKVGRLLEGISDRESAGNKPPTFTMLTTEPGPDVAPIAGKSAMQHRESGSRGAVALCSSRQTGQLGFI